MERPTNRAAVVALFSSGLALVLFLVVLVSVEEPAGPYVYLGSLGLAILGLASGILAIRPARRGARPGLFAAATASILALVPIAMVGSDVVDRMGRLGRERAVPDARLAELGSSMDIPVYYLGRRHGDLVLDRVSRGHFGEGNPVPGLLFLHYSGRCSLAARLFPEFWRCGQEVEIEIRDVCSAWERPRGERRTVRGVPAELGPTEGRLWLWTDRVRIQILRLAGASAVDVVQVAESLRGLQVELGVQDLSPPGWDPWSDEGPPDC